MSGRPIVVCLCGSTRFSEEFAAANLRETLAGNIVLTVGCMTHSDAELQITPEQKTKLDELHKRKIDMADEILVLNVRVCTRCGSPFQGSWDKGPYGKLSPGCCVEGHDKSPYIGDSTRSEIAYALQNGKMVRLLEPQGPTGVTLIKPSPNEHAVGYYMRDLGLGRCAECDPSFGCFDGSAPCSKKPL